MLSTDNKLVFLATALLLLSACGGGDASSPIVEVTAEPPEDSVGNLYILAPMDMPVGVAVPAGNASNSVLTSLLRQDVVNAHFSQVTAENIMKPSFLHPSELTYSFNDADALVTYANGQGKTVHGHVLIWHNQLANWMTNYVGDSAAWTSMMTDHIAEVTSHFAGGDVVVSWDVVNEAFTDNDGDDDGIYDLRNTIWHDNIGAGYLALAFRTAAAADPNADLYYNDYNIAGVPAKLNAVLGLVDQFQNDPNPVPIHGIGFQMHVSLG